MFPQEYVGMLEVPEQFGLDVGSLSDIDPLARVRESVDARCRRCILVHRYRSERTVPVVSKGHYRVSPSGGTSLSAALPVSELSRFMATLPANIVVPS
jgi:hypothetical protein